MSDSPLSRRLGSFLNPLDSALFIFVHFTPILVFGGVVTGTTVVAHTHWHRSLRISFFYGLITAVVVTVFLAARTRTLFEMGMRCLLFMALALVLLPLLFPLLSRVPPMRRVHPRLPNAVR